MEVGEVIQFYDSDRLFPAWGFGGKIYDGTVSHCFNLNGSPCDSEVRGFFFSYFFLVEWLFLYSSPLEMVDNCVGYDATLFLKG